MKIDNSPKTINPAQSPAGSPASASRRAATAVRAENLPAEQPASVVSSTLNSVVGAEATFNSQKVAEIKQAISENRFQMDPERIADGLLGSVREMLAQQNSRASSR